MNRGRLEERISGLGSTYREDLYIEIKEAAELGWTLSDEYMDELIDEAYDMQQFDEYLAEQEWIKDMMAKEETQYQGYIIL